MSELKFNVYSLEEAAPEKRKEIEEKLASPQFSILRRPAEQFDEYGLRFPIDYLNEIGGNIIFLPLERTAEYVDIITKAAVDDGDIGFGNEVLQDANSDLDFSTVNTTGLGNIAYVCLHSKEQSVRAAAFQILQKYADWYCEQLVKITAEEAKKGGVN